MAMDMGTGDFEIDSTMIGYPNEEECGDALEDPPFANPTLTEIETMAEIAAEAAILREAEMSAEAVVEAFILRIRESTERHELVPLNVGSVNFHLNADSRANSMALDTTPASAVVAVTPERRTPTVSLTKHVLDSVMSMRNFAHNLAPVEKQMLGSVAGGLTGYAVAAIGKRIALIVGGSLLFVQVAQKHGFIRLDSEAIKHSLVDARRAMENEARQIPNVVVSMAEMAIQHVDWVGGFVSGFLLSLGSF